MLKGSITDSPLCLLAPSADPMILRRDRSLLGRPRQYRAGSGRGPLEGSSYSSRTPIGENGGRSGHGQAPTAEFDHARERQALRANQRNYRCEDSGSLHRYRRATWRTCLCLHDGLRYFRTTVDRVNTRNGKAGQRFPEISHRGVWKEIGVVQPPVSEASASRPFHYVF